MENKNYLIDTNVAIFYFGLALTQKSESFIDKLLKDTYYLSVINRIELLGFKGLSQKESLVFEAFVKNGMLINLDEDIIIETILLRKEYPIKLPDAIIAATCIVNSLTLISNNSKDFEKIKGLSLHRV